MILPSKETMGPRKFHDMAAQTIRDPPPFFTVRSSQSGLYAFLGCLHTYTHPAVGKLEKNRLVGEYYCFHWSLSINLEVWPELLRLPRVFPCFLNSVMALDMVALEKPVTVSCDTSSNNLPFLILHLGYVFELNF